MHVFRAITAIMLLHEVCQLFDFLTKPFTKEEKYALFDGRRTRSGCQFTGREGWNLLCHVQNIGLILLSKPEWLINFCGRWQKAFKGAAKCWSNFAIWWHARQCSFLAPLTRLLPTWDFIRHNWLVCLLHLRHKGSSVSGLTTGSNLHTHFLCTNRSAKQTNS